MPLSSLFTKTSPERKKAQQYLLKKKVNILLQEEGNIQKISTPLNEDNYRVLKKEYKPLLKDIEDNQSLLVDLNKSLAIIAFRAGQDASTLSTYLKAWEQSANADDFKTELQTILEGRIKFLQETGNITKGNEPLDSSEYTSSKSIYDSLVKTIKDYSLSDEIKTKLSFDLNKCQAISAVRANSKDASTYLKACGSISANRNDFIIELYKIIELHKKAANNVQNPELKITTQLYKPLLKQAFEAVDSFLNSNNYVAALDEIKPLIKDANTVLTLAKYVEICIKEAIPKKLEECWNQCLMTTSSTIEKSKTLAGIFEDLHKTFESLGNAETKTKAKYEDIAKQAKARAIQYTPQKEEVQDKEPEKKATLTKEEQIAQKKVEKDEEKLKQAQKKYVDSVIEAEKIKNAKKAEDERLAAIKKANEEAAAKKAKEDAEIEAQAKITLDAMQALVKKDDTSLTPTAPPKEVEASDSSNVVKTSDSSNVAETSGSSNKSGKGLYPSIRELEAELAAAKASSSINVYNNSPYSYTAGTHKTAPITAVMPTSRSADPTDAAEIAAAKEAAAKEAAEVLKTTLLENVKEFITSSKTDTMKQIIVDCDNAIKKGINVYETVNDVKTLEVLASGFLSLNNQEKAGEICGKIAGISQDAYRGIRDNKVLSLLAKKYSELELYNSCIKSFENSRTNSEENYQLLKAIAEKTTDTDIQLAALTAAKSQTDNPKQKAELFLSKGKILLSLGKKEQASNEFGEAATYNHDIYKDVAVETLKSLYESGNHEVGYWYLSKTHNFNHKDPIIAAKLAEFSRYMNSIHGIPGEAACLIKAYLCAPNADALVQVKNDLSIMRNKPYSADYYKDCCAINNNPAQIETYLQGIVQVIDEHM